MNLFGGMETNSTKRDNSWMRVWGRQYGFASAVNFSPDAYEKAARENSEIASFGRTLDRTAAFFGTATYSYKGRYIVNGTLRYEGTNTLGRAHFLTLHAEGFLLAHRRPWSLRHFELEPHHE